MNDCGCNNVGLRDDSKSIFQLIKDNPVKSVGIAGGVGLAIYFISKQFGAKENA